jgi:ribonuclease P protein component
MPEFNFPPASRLLKSADFSQVFENTEWRGSTPQLLILASSNKLEHPRLGFVLAKKQIRHAVDRNRIKRLIRESFRLNQSKLDSLDFVILARNGATELNNQELRAAVDALWFRLKRPKHGKSGKSKRSNSR